MDKKEALTKAKKYKLLLMDFIDLEKVYLYGSFAKDTPREDSDIDIAIVVNQLPDDFFSINPLLWKLRRRIDDRIEPILIDKNNDQAGFLDEIIRTGIEIA